VWRGGLGGAYPLPTLSSVGASLAPPCFRFHTPLIEPDVRICRIRLSEKTHTIAKAIACDGRLRLLKTTAGGPRGTAPWPGQDDRSTPGTPPQRRAACPACASWPLRASASGLLPRLVIGARRHRGIPAVTGDDPLQPGDLLRLPLYQRPQVRDHRVLVLVQQPQPLQRLAQPPVSPHAAQQRQAQSGVPGTRHYTTAGAQQAINTSAGQPRKRTAVHARV